MLGVEIYWQDENGHKVIIINDKVINFGDFLMYREVNMF